MLYTFFVIIIKKNYYLAFIIWENILVSYWILKNVLNASNVLKSLLINHFLILTVRYFTIYTR